MATLVAVCNMTATPRVRRRAGSGALAFPPPWSMVVLKRLRLLLRSLTLLPLTHGAGCFLFHLPPVAAGMRCRPHTFILVYWPLIGLQ
jgi:hypothetical protein